MHLSTLKQRSHLLILIPTIVSFALTLFFFYTYYSDHTFLLESTQQEAQKQTEQAGRELNRFIELLKPLVQELAMTITEEGSLEHNTIISALQKKPVEVAGFGFLRIDGKKWAPYFVEHQDAQQLIYLDQERSDYTASDWYNAGAVGTSGMSKPFLDPVTRKPVIAFYMPVFSNATREVIGIVFATQSVEHLKHVLTTLYLGQAGYWILTDSAGTILVDPSNNVVKEQQSLYTIAQKSDDDILLTNAQQAAAGHPSTSFYVNSKTDNNAWLSSATIPAAGNWLLFGIFDVFPQNDLVRQQLMRVILALLITCIFAITFCLIHIKATIWFLWFFSGVLSLVIAVTVAALWIITALYPHYKQDQVMPVRNKISLYQFLDQLSLTHKSHNTTDIAEKIAQENPIMHNFDYYLHYRYKAGRYVPTGFLIQDINFISKDQIEFVGIIWQRYFAEIHDGVSRGFILQQLTGRPDIEEISRANTGKEETIVWLVHAQLNQIMSYRDFPFDVKNIHIQISHKDFDKNIVLVPDLDSYSMLNPETMPGVSDQAHLAGWRLHSSFFGYEIMDYRTTFGMYAYGPFGIWKQLDKSHVPELHFIVQAKRYLIETLTMDVITLLVIALILFILLFTYQERGFSNTLSTFGAVLFSTILAQQYFKVKIPSEEFVYFESFYFIMYLAILTTLILSLLDYFETNIRFIRYKNNFIARLLFWPCLLGIVCFITVFYLY